MGIVGENGQDDEKVAEKCGVRQLGAPVESAERDAERVPPDPITGGTMKLNPLRLNPAPAVMPVSLLHVHDAFGAISALKVSAPTCQGDRLGTEHHSILTLNRILCFLWPQSRSGRSASPSPPRAQ